MLARPRRRLPSPAMIVALVALVLALGGTGYAAVVLPKNSVGAPQLKKSSVTAKKIRGGAITSAKIKDRSLLARDFKSGQLLAGPQGAPGPQGVPGPSNAYYAVQTGNATLAADGAQAAVATVSLPAGSYTFSSQSYVFRSSSSGDSDQVICYLLSGGTVLGGYPSQISPEPTADLAFFAAATLPAAATVQLTCRQILQPPDTADTLVIIGSRVLATRVNELTQAP